MSLRSTLIASLLLIACDSSAPPASDAGGATDGGSASSDGGSPGADGGSPGADGGGGTSLPGQIGPSERPARLFVPDAHDGETPLPLLVLLHGYSASGAVQDLYFGVSREARTRGLYVVVPDGTLDTSGNRFWNATPACCDFGGNGVDDVAYLIGLVDEMEALAPIGDVFFLGHSNGGFMSYRMACEHADRISAIASLAGADFIGADDCAPSEPVSVLQIHGDLDATIAYLGLAAAYPSAPDAVRRWAGRAGCDLGAAADGDPLDLESALIGAETEVVDYATGCERSSSLWTIRGGAHVPALNLGFAPTVFDWLTAHGR